MVSSEDELTMFLALIGKQTRVWIGRYSVGRMPNGIATGSLWAPTHFNFNMFGAETTHGRDIRPYEIRCLPGSHGTICALRTFVSTSGW